MKIKNYTKVNTEKLFRNYTLDKKFAILFNNKKIALFRLNNAEEYCLITEIFENNKFSKWSKINNIILS